MTGFSPETVPKQCKVGLLVRDTIYVTRNHEGRVIMGLYRGVRHKPQFRLRIWRSMPCLAASLYVRPVSRLPRRTR